VGVADWPCYICHENLKASDTEIKINIDMAPKDLHRIIEVRIGLNIWKTNTTNSGIANALTIENVKANNSGDDPKALFNPSTYPSHKLISNKNKHK
jgi:hypothetical protein